MAEFKVSEFKVELSLQERITKELPKLETKVQQSALRMERALNKAFQGDFTKKTRDSLTALDRQVTSTARHIDRAFNGVRVNGNRMFGNIPSAARRAARDAQRALDGIHAPSTSTPATGRSGGGRRGSNLQSSAAFQNLQNMGGRASVRANEILARATMRLEQFSGDVAQTNNTIGQFRRELSEAARAARAEAQAARRDRRPASVERMNSGISGGNRFLGGGLTAGLLKANIWAQTAEAVVGAGKEAIQKGYDVGKERAQASTMLHTAVGEQAAPDMQNKLNQYANDFGLNKADATKEYSKMRNVLPQDVMNNDQLLSFQRNESVFAHSTGMSNDAVARVNNALGQIAASPKIQQQDVNQIKDAMPEWKKALAEGMGKPIKEAMAVYKQMAPAEFIQTLSKGMDSLNQKSGATAIAMASLQSAEGRLGNAIDDAAAAIYGKDLNLLPDIIDGLASAVEESVPYIEKLRDGFLTAAGVMGQLWDWTVKTYNEIASIVGTEVGAEFKQLWSDFESVADNYLGVFKSVTDTFNSLSPDAKDDVSGLGSELFKLSLIPYKWMAEGLHIMLETLSEVYKFLQHPIDNTSDYLSGLKEKLKVGLSDLTTLVPNHPPAAATALAANYRMPVSQGIPSALAPNNTNNQQVNVKTQFDPIKVIVADTSGNVKGTATAQPIQSIESGYHGAFPLARK